MIKEKDYPYFCYEEGKEKFERFVRDYNIRGRAKLPRRKQYFYFREEEKISFIHDQAMRTTCDHPSIWYSASEEGERIYHIVFQSYGTTETVLQEMRRSALFIPECMVSRCHVTIYSNEKYNWHNDGMVTIIVTLKTREYIMPARNLLYVEENEHDREKYQLHSFIIADSNHEAA